MSDETSSNGDNDSEASGCSHGNDDEDIGGESGPGGDANGILQT